MNAIILAGGFGTRLRSVVNNIPKCMALVAGKPFLYYLLNYLSKYKEIDKVVLSVGYLKTVIIDWIRENKDSFPFSFDFAVEEEPLGTGGAIKRALERTDSMKVLVLNGDTFFNVDLNNLFAFSNTSITVALKPMKNFERYGTVTVNRNGIISSFNEKMYCREGLINGGMYVIDKTKYDLSNFPNEFSFEIDLLQDEIGKETLSGFVDDGYFIDIGIPDDYAIANSQFSKMK